MKRLLVTLFLFAGLSVTAQKDTLMTVPDTDSFMKEQIRKMDSVNTANSLRTMNNNMTSFLHDMNERKRKQEQQMWLRFGFAGLMIAVLIVGLVRKKKQKTEA